MVSEYKRIVTRFFSDSFAQKQTIQNQVAAAMLQVIPSVYAIFQKTVFLFRFTEKKNTLWVKTFVLPSTMNRFASYPSVDITL